MDQHAVSTILLGELAQRLKVPVDTIDPDVSFLELGADSILLVDTTAQIEKRFGQRIAIPDLFERLDTVTKLAAHLSAAGPVESPEPAPAPVITADNFPNGNNPASIYDILQAQSALIDHVVTRQNQALAILARYQGGSGSGWNSAATLRRSNEEQLH